MYMSYRRFIFIFINTFHTTIQAWLWNCCLVVVSNNNDSNENYSAPNLAFKVQIMYSNENSLHLAVKVTEI